MDNQSACPVFSALMERAVEVIGLSPIELGADSIGNAESMRLLGRSDVLRLRQAVYAEISLIPGLFDLDRINGIKGVVCPLVATGPSNATEPDAVPVPIDIHTQGWVLSTRTYIAVAGLVTVPLVVYMLYLLIKQAIHNSRLCKRSSADKETQLGLMAGELIDVRDWASVDEDGREPADLAVTEAAKDQFLSDDAVNEAGSSFVARSASLFFFKLGVLPAWLPSVSLPFSIPFVSPTTGALLKMTEIADAALKKSSACIVDALAPLVFGTLLMLTTATGILLFGVGRVGIAKIAESGIFGLNEDAIDTLLEMIHMQWRLIRQLKWSWWLSVAGRYESRCQWSRQEQLGEGTDITSELEVEHEPEPRRIHGHHVCTDTAFPFQQVIPHNMPQTGVPPVESAQSSSAKDTGLTPQKEGDVKTSGKPGAVTEANATNGTDIAPHDKPRHGQSHQHHRAGHEHGEYHQEHIKLDTRRDWLRWLVRGKDGKGSHYRDRHQWHNVSNASSDVKAGKTGSKNIKKSTSKSKVAESVAE